MTPWGRGVKPQNASILAFVSPSFCVQSLSFVILRLLAFARRPISPPSSLVVPHSLSIPSIRNLGKFSNPIPLLVIVDCRFLVTPSESRPQTRCNRRARPKEKFRLHSRSMAPTLLCVLFFCSYIPYILQVSLYISQSTLDHIHHISVGRGCRSQVIEEFGTRPT